MTKKNAPTQTASKGALDSRHSTARDLFPETLPPVVPATWPPEGSRAREALDTLLNGEPVTQAEYLASWRLAASVKALRYEGWAIRSRRISRAGCRRPIAEYCLDRSDPATAAALEARHA